MLGVLVLTHGCDFFSHSYHVGEVDYGSPQKAAEILLGDPQVYARASLINDRRHEIEYLNQLLANSSVDAQGQSIVKFTPQIVRDLRTLEALSTSLGLSIGSKGTEPSTAELGRQVEIAKLQAQLAVLNKQIEGIEAAAPPQVSIPSPELQSSAASPPTTTDVAYPDITALQASIGEIRKQLGTLVTVPAASSPTTPAQTLSDPRDDLLDRQAYRRDVRAALAEAQLDDTHDRGGNALYRLQFQATVLPPDGSTRQWGIARLEVEPPTLSSKEIVAKYFNWLSHVTSVLSDRPTEGSHNYDYDRFISQLGSLGYLEVVDFVLDDTGQRYCLLHSTATDSQLRSISEGAGEGKLLLFKGADGGLYSWRGTFAVPPKLPNSNGVHTSTRELCGRYPILQDSRITMPSPFPQQAANLVFGEIRKYDREAVRALSYDLLPSTVGSNATRAAYVPAVFCEKLATPVSKGGGNCDNLSSSGNFVAMGGEAGGDYAVRSYSVLPAELAQRLGVTTEAAQSLQAALSVAAQVSESVKGGLDIGYLSQSSARAEALERQPLVVGFAGSKGCIDKDSACTPQPGGFFGWFFGPQFAIRDSTHLDLRQSVRSYGVNADLSVPGWWGALSLNVKTAWVGDWRAGQLIGDSPLSEFEKAVALPQLGDAYDSLTDFIATKEYGTLNSHIFARSVAPNVVPTCASNVTFQIRGSNIWRANTASLAGVPAKSINVLPDMNGITAEFDMSDVFGRLASFDTSVEALPLLVAAEQGAADPLLVYVVGKRSSSNGATSCHSPLLSPTQLSLIDPLIVSLVPGEICSNVASVWLTVNALNLEGDLKVKSESFKEQEVKFEKGRAQHAVKLELAPGSRLLPGSSTVTFALANGSFAVAATLSVKECKGKSDQPEKTKATLVTQSVKRAKDQKIVVKAPIPNSYAEVVLQVRPKTEKDNADWLPAATSTPEPGDSSEVAATMDLSKLPPEIQKLEVIVKIRSRPGLDWEAPIQVDKLVSVETSANAGS